ncbi:uncharacterized protein LOC134822123 isoform X2 [Bolinopsis microptera]|uniref:uncharacterized protein LOC134822123 isoform X2 n=1 Tax=Bolinopsis microptera TaxID=2820187 RepID=UPI00307AD2C1
MVYQEVSCDLQNALARERKDVIETDLESVVVILGEESKCLIPLVSNFDPLLRDFDKVLTDLAQTEVACGEYREKWEQSEIHVKTLKQHKKSLELRIVELEALHQAELRRWNEEKKQLERRLEDFEWKIDQRETDMQRLSKLNSELQKQLAASSEQLQNLKKARNITRKFSSAVRMVKQQKDNDVTQKIIKKLEEDSEQYSDRFNILDNENSALARQLEEAHDLIEEMRRRDELLCNERREWKVEREDLLEESVHLRAQMKILEADLNKHYSASKSLQSQIRKAEADIKTYEVETKRVADENQLLESQLTRIKTILTTEGLSLEKYPELNLKLPDEHTVKKIRIRSPPLLEEIPKHEISLQDELNLEGALINERLRQASDVGDTESLEMKNTQLEQELLRSETEKNALLVDVHRAEKIAGSKDKEINSLKDELKSVTTKILDLESQLEVYEEQRSVMEEQQMKLAERFVRNSRARRSFSRTNSSSNLSNTNASDNDSEGVNDTLFDENMQLIREKQTLLTKYTQLEAKSLEVERTLKDQKSEAERKLRRLEEDYSTIMSSEQKMSELLKEMSLKFERLKCLYNLLQSEDNEGEDPEELVARLKYKRGEVEALLRDRTEMRTQIVSLQKMITMRSVEEHKTDLNTGGIVSRILAALRKRRSTKSVGALGIIAKTTSGAVGKDLGHSLLELNRRTSIAEWACMRGSEYSARKIEELKELSSVPRKISNGWTYSPAGIFSNGLPPSIPLYSKLLMLDDRPQRVICTCFVPRWPFPRFSGVRIMLDKSTRSQSTESSASATKTSFEGRDSSSKSKDSSSRGSTWSSKNSMRSTRSMDGKSHFPLIEEAVINSENVALGMLCMSSLKPLACVALETRVIERVSSKAEDGMSASLFSQDVLRNSIKHGTPSSLENRTHGEVSEAEFVDKPEEESCGRSEVKESCGRGAEAAGDDEECAKDPKENGDTGNNEEREESAEDAEMRRELFRQTKDAFLKRPVASFRHKVSHNSRSLYPFLWTVSYVDETNLSFLHIVNLNFPARVTRTQFLCESKVQTMAIINHSATGTSPEVKAKKVLFGTEQSSEAHCWMGTSDGRLFIIELEEPFTQIYSQHLTDSVQQILHVEPHVFVSLHNGALVVFNRDKQGLWDMDNYQIIVIDTTGRKVRKISYSDNRLWCGSGPTVSIYNTDNYRIDEKVDVVIGNNERIREVVHIADTVWISLSNSTKIVIFSRETRQILRVISLKGYLLRTGLRHGLDLQRCDLYITTMFYDGNLVWIGTNIGVVLAVMFPVDVVSREASPEGGRDSHLSSVDDELSWDPEDKLLNSTSRDPAEIKPVSSEDQGGIQTDGETAQPDSPASHHTPGREEEKMKSRGSSLTECGPVWDETQEETDEIGETEETHETGEQVLLNKDESFDFSHNLETEPPSPNKQSSMTEEIEDMIASFDLDSIARTRVQSLNEEHILFSVYGNQGPVSCFCSVGGDEDLPSLLCAGGIGFDDYEVKGLKSVRRKDCIEADSPNDPRLLAQLLMWSYSK